MKRIKKVLLTTVIFSILLTGCSENDGYSSSDISLDEVDPKENPYKSAGWYGKTVVSATTTDGTVYQHTTAGVFGELIQSSDDKDKHDIAGFGPAKLQVVFSHPEWSENNGYYFSDYRKYEEDVKKVWTFQVLNTYVAGHPDYGVDLADVTIHLDLTILNDVEYRDDRGKVEFKESTSTDDVLKNMLHLVDVDEQKVYTLVELKTATLTMAGKHTRTFRWVLGSVDNVDKQPLVSAQRAASRRSVDTDRQGFNISPMNVSTGKFGLPPR